MQMSGSQTGISSVMIRFSHCVVPVGNVPSTGIALTGSTSPLPAMMVAVTFFTNSGALSDTVGGISMVLVACAGHLYLVQVASGGIDCGKVLLNDLLTALAISLLNGVLDLAIASSCGSTPLMAKKQVCMIVLMRAPMPVSPATS